MYTFTPQFKGTPAAHTVITHRVSKLKKHQLQSDSPGNSCMEKSQLSKVRWHQGASGVILTFSREVIGLRVREMSSLLLYLVVFIISTTRYAKSPVLVIVWVVV